MPSICMSMTGYGRGQVSASGVRITVELRSVNHRFLDFQIKLPRAWAALEAEVGKQLRDRLQRGRVEAYVKREVLADAAQDAVRIDKALAAQLYAQSCALATELGFDEGLRLGELLRLPGVLEVRELDVAAQEESPLLHRAVDMALDELLEMRAAEGGRLRADLLSRLDHSSTLVSEIRTLAQGQVVVLQSRLQSRVSELLLDHLPDESRIAQEVALLVDKAAVDEELTRLDSHIEQARIFLAQDDPAGRQLNFLVQEMNREANTCGSKSGLEEISRRVVDLKSEIEKIREQVANLE